MKKNVSEIKSHYINFFRFPSYYKFSLRCRNQIGEWQEGEEKCFPSS